MARTAYFTWIYGTGRMESYIDSVYRTTVLNRVGASLMLLFLSVVFILLFRILKKFKLETDLDAEKALLLFLMSVVSLLAFVCMSAGVTDLIALAITDKYQVVSTHF